MDTVELKKRLSAALRIASLASDFLIRHEKMRFEIENKAENDYVTSADKAVEELIHTEIEKEFPLDGWYGEESGEEGDSKKRWIVDPIDGTVDFMWSFPLYTVSIAFEDKDGIALGVVALPGQGEVFHAMRGEGAYLNERKLIMESGVESHRSLALLVPPHRKHSSLDEYIVRMRRFYEHFSDMRSIGSAACSLCYVASGRCSIYYEEFLHIYDIAAGILILREAGGTVSLKKEENDELSILASCSSCHNLGLELIDGKGSYIRF